MNWSLAFAGRTKQRRSVAAGLCLLLLALCSICQTRGATYTTLFPLDENPISEGGNWLNGYTDGLDWSDVATTNALAFGLQSGVTGYDDSTALLTGNWNSNQMVIATVHTANPQGDDVYEEVELRLCSSLTPGYCTGYEINFSLRPDSSAYTQIVRWNGAVGDFTYVAIVNGPNSMIHDGDTLMATIANGTITAFINGIPIVQGTDTTYTSGNPGMGFFLSGTTGVNMDFGFTSFTASDDVSAPVIGSSPQDQLANLGSNVIFQVTATGTSPLFYQWYFNSNAIDGATDRQLLLTNIQDTDGGLYQVSVSNAFGSVLSDNAQLFIAKTYGTTFPLTEEPISEGGNWLNGYTDGLDWSDVATANGLAFGLQSGLNGYDDATALLTGPWGPNQVVAATVHRTNQQSEGHYEQVELRLRSSLSAHSCTGYEVNFSLGADSSASVGIVRWNGALGDFTPLNGVNGSQYILNDGDEVRATIIGNTIAAYIRGIKVLETTDGAYSTGNPGMGFSLAGTTGVNTNYGFTRFTASDDVVPLVIAAQPQSQLVNVNSNATFSVTASGTSPLSYQWYFNITNVVDGATNSELILTNVQDSNQGLFQVLVGNVFGTVLSDAAQLIVNQLPQPSSPTFQRYVGADLQVPETLLLGTDTDGDLLSLVSVESPTTQGATVRDVAGWIYYSAPAGLTINDSFDYTVTDWRGGFATGIVKVNVIAASGPSLSIEWDSGRGTVHLVGSGIANCSYTIEFTTSLSNPVWTTITTMVSDDSGAFYYDEPAPAGGGNRYYRAVSP